MDCIALGFAYNNEVIDLCKNLGASWSQSNKCWYVKKESVALSQIFDHFKGKAWVDASDFYEGKKPEFQNAPRATKLRSTKPQPVVSIPTEYLNLLIQRRYSDNTKRTYTSLFAQYMQHFAPTHPDDVSEAEINDYILGLVKLKNISRSTQNQVINAIKFYYEKVKKLEKTEYWIERPKKERQLPKVLSKEQVGLMLSSTPNPKHYCIIALLYSAGLRRSELIGLRMQDLNFDRNTIHIKGGKGQKDRISLLSKVIKPALLSYIENQKPQYWLFEGPTRKRYSGTSIGNIVKQAAQKSNISMRVTPHMLRHSFATHLMDDGIDTRQIQKLLGHNSILTTSIYTHVSQKDLAKITSPLDRFTNNN